MVMYINVLFVINIVQWYDCVLLLVVVIVIVAVVVVVVVVVHNLICVLLI